VVNLALEDAKNLYGAEIQLVYNPARLRVQDDNPRLAGVQIKPGPLLAFDNRFVATNRANSETGSIDFVFTLLRPAGPIDRDGVLATVIFEIVEEGAYSVAINHAQLVSADSEPLPVTVDHLQVGNELNHTSAQLSAPRANRFWWVAPLLLVGLVILGWGFARYIRRASPSFVSGAGDLSFRNVPAESRTSIRSANLLTRQANYLLGQGYMEAAYELFSQAVELDPANVEAWLGKGIVAQQEIEKRICFQRVLALDPDNVIAKKEIEHF
jgi:tetratricopeptide (TPR) repeat protein